MQQEVAQVVRCRLRPRNLRPRAALDLCAMGEVLVRQKVSEAWRELADLLTWPFDERLAAGANRERARRSRYRRRTPLPRPSTSAPDGRRSASASSEPPTHLPARAEVSTSHPGRLGAALRSPPFPRAKRGRDAVVWWSGRASCAVQPVMELLRMGPFYITAWPAPRLVPFCPLTYSVRCRAPGSGEGRLRLER